MHIWVDADACPGAIKDILYRAADRLKIRTTLVANSFLRTPPSPYVDTLQVEKGLDVADAKIAQLLAPGDLVVTADIPLAAIVIEKGGHALNPRGEFYTADNIRETLSMRNFMESLRQGGVETAAPRLSAWPTARRSPTSSTASWRAHRRKRPFGFREVLEPIGGL